MQGINKIIENNVFQIKGNDLYIDGTKASDIAKEYGTPLFVLSETYIRKKCMEMKKDFLDVYPKGRAAYAGKAFLTKAICKIIEDEGFSLDVVSGGELYTAIAAEFPAERIEFNGNNKSLEEIEMAISYGVGRIIIDGNEEVALLEEECKKQGKKVNCIIRISPEIKVDTHDYISTGKKDSKFGVPLQEGGLDKVIADAMASPYINLMGFHFHVGSQLHTNNSHIKATKVLLSIIEKAKDDFGLITEEINIGGGFGINYTDEDDEKEYKYFFEPVIKEITNAFKKMNMELPAIVTEPGRSLVGNAGMTLYTVGSMKEIEGVRTYVSIDGGMTDNIRPALYQSEYQAILVNRCDEKTVGKYTVCGKCCESGDIILKDIELPLPKRGDVLGVFSTGAYCYTMSSNYNKLPIPAVVMTNDNGHKLIVRRQTNEDLISREL